MKNIVVMTATITPPYGAFALARTDPAQRLADYATALRHYLDALGRGAFELLVFAENSSSDLDPLRAIVTRSAITTRCSF